MHPELFRVGPVPIATYGLMVVLAAVVAVQWGRREIVARDRLLTEDQFWNQVYGAVILSFAGAKLLYWIVFWRELGGLAGMLSTLRYGFIYFGGVTACVLGFFAYYRRRGLPAWKILDRAAPPVAMAHAVGRLGCFAAGCCHGGPTDLPWGVAFTSRLSLVPREWLGTPLHPTQLYDAGGNVLLSLFLYYFVLARVRAGRLADGSAILAYAAGYGLLRFLLEFVRGDYRGGHVWAGLTFYQWFGLVFAVLTLGLLIRRNLGRRSS